jgi:hypothetical protein
VEEVGRLAVDGQPIPFLLVIFVPNTSFVPCNFNVFLTQSNPVSLYCIVGGRKACSHYRRRGTMSIIDRFDGHGTILALPAGYPKKSDRYEFGDGAARIPSATASAVEGRNPSRYGWLSHEFYQYRFLLFLTH